MYGLGGVRRPYCFGNQGASWTLAGFWAACAEYTGHQLGLERIGHSSAISALQPKTMEGVMMYFDVPSSKMPEERSNRVLNASNGPFCLAFVCPHTCQQNFGSSRNPKRKNCTDKISMILATWSPGPSSLQSPFQALFGKYTHTPPMERCFCALSRLGQKPVSSSKTPSCPPPPTKTDIYIYIYVNMCVYVYVWGGGDWGTNGGFASVG